MSTVGTQYLLDLPLLQTWGPYPTETVLWSTLTPERGPECCCCPSERSPSACCLQGKSFTTARCNCWLIHSALCRGKSNSLIDLYILLSILISFQKLFLMSLTAFLFHYITGDIFLLFFRLYYFDFKEFDLLLTLGELPAQT